jgi:hypothetical protein
VFKPTTYGYELPINDASKANEQYTKNVQLQCDNRKCLLTSPEDKCALKHGIIRWLATAVSSQEQI